MSSLFDSMDLNLLRVYEALMSEGNVTRAAIKLNRTQPAISNSLARLREMLGDPLFDTTATGVRPTVRGRELWAQLEPHCRGIEEALSPDGFDAFRYEGRFLVSTTDYALVRLMPRLLPVLQTQAPGMSIDVIPFTRTELEWLFERGGLDMAVGTRPGDSADVVRGLRLHALWPVEYCCLMRRDHPLATGVLTLERFLQARHMDVLLPGMPGPIYDTLLAAHGVRRRVALTVNDHLPIPAIVAESDLVAILQAPVADLGHYASRVCERELPIPLAGRQINLIWHSRQERSSAHRWLRNCIVDLFEDTSMPA
ncbi:LysR family transcriptional regulator [Variovorax sp. GT1P44]|uniref:LysR family transcriptional regulator n=1 Tax=Variovorax sp. GT1P44 TaxID=3443742 RepID=UPI003F4556A0